MRSTSTRRAAGRDHSDGGTGRARRGRTLLAAVTIVAVAVLGACSSDDDSASSDGASSTTTTTTAAPSTSGAKELVVLVSNDDGIGAPGIDALVEGLRSVPDTKVIVSAPATQQSGTDGKTTPGGPPPGVDATTASGFAGKAVPGFPADSVNWALDGGITEKPDLVITGINAGENLGKLTEVSGTVGAARAAANHGIPALATSQGIAGTPDYPTGVKVVLDWLAEHRSEVLAGEYSASTPAPVWNMNFPNCAPGTTNRGVIEVPVDTSDDPQFQQPDCASTATGPATDLAAFKIGFVPLTELSATPTAPAPGG
jgi:5'/3'-nucleotidase